MDGTVLFLFALGIIVFGVINRQRGRFQDVKDKKPLGWGIPEEERLDPNDRFLAAAQGQEVIKLVRTFNQEDEMMLRSLLEGSEILTFLHNSHMSGLFPGLNIPGYTDAILAVMEKDVEGAQELVRDYIEQLRHRQNLLRNEKAFPELMV